MSSRAAPLLFIVLPLAFLPVRTGAQQEQWEAVVIRVQEVVDARALGVRLSQAGFSLAERHREVILTLQETARASQAPLLEDLRAWEQEGRVEAIQPFWIDNLVALRARPEVLEALEEDPRVVRVYPDVTISFPEPLAGLATQPPEGEPEPGIRLMRADSLWNLGLTGRGIVVAIVDLGVDVDHPALVGKWRGLRVPAEQAWFDPHQFTGKPFDDSGISHGTMVTGIAVGGDRDIGVAFDAEWIAANLFEVTPEPGCRFVGCTTLSKIITSLQWVADPDGNPATMADVPDVANNSWGSQEEEIACSDVLDGVLGGLEGAGVVVVFAAGNRGPLEQSVAFPAHLARSGLLAVGSIDSTGGLSVFSGRGPSPCDERVIKPELVGVGQSVRSAVRGEDFGRRDGTSFSTPYVAGLAALLKGFNPELTPEVIRAALIGTARDLGEVGPDDDFGFGLPDAVAALGQLTPPSAPVFRLSGIQVEDVGTGNGDRILDSGETADLVLGLLNLGAPAGSVQGVLTALDQGVEILAATVAFGAIDRFGQAEGRFRVRMPTSVPVGTAFTFALQVFSPSGSGADLTFQVRVGGSPGGGLVTHGAGRVRFTVTNFGRYGFFSGVESIGEGFRFPPLGINRLFHGAVFLAAGPDRVSDGFYQDDDFQPVAPGPFELVSPGRIVQEETISAFDDRIAPSPIGLRVEQETFAEASPPWEDFVVMVYRIINQSGRTVPQLVVGLYFDWDFSGETPSVADLVGWDEERDLGFMFGAEGAGPFVGLHPLGAPALSYRAIRNAETFPEGDEFTDREKFEFMLEGRQVVEVTRALDASHLISVGPLLVAAGDTAIVAFAVLAGEDLEDLQANAEAADGLFQERILPLFSEPPAQPVLTGRLVLFQNFPNPLILGSRAETQIQFEIPEEMGRTPVQVAVYNIRGQLVRELIGGEERGPGLASILWDGTNDRGERVATGVYFYTLEAGGETRVKKLVVLK